MLYKYYNTLYYVMWKIKWHKNRSCAVLCVLKLSPLDDTSGSLKLTAMSIKLLSNRMHSPGAHLHPRDACVVQWKQQLEEEQVWWGCQWWNWVCVLLVAPYFSLFFNSSKHHSIINKHHWSSKLFNHQSNTREFSAVSFCVETEKWTLMDRIFFSSFLCIC